MEKKRASVGLIVIAVILIMTATCACTNRNENRATIQASSTTPSASSVAPTKTTVRVTATSLGSSQSLTSPFGTPTAAATGNKFVKYAIYCENVNAKDTLMGNPNFLKLRDTDSNIYSYDSSTFLLQQQVNGMTLKGLQGEPNTQPGDKYSGLIVFQIPQNATPKSLTYSDYTNRITINL